LFNLKKSEAHQPNYKWDFRTLFSSFPWRYGC